MTRSERFRLGLRIYFEVWDVVGGDPAKVAQEFEALAEVARGFIPRKRKGRHDPDFDRALLAAYDAAPKGQRTEATRDVGKAHGSEAGAFLSLLRCSVAGLNLVSAREPRK